MLIAWTEAGERLAASMAVRGTRARCPACLEVVTLKAGPVIARHFAHLVGNDCANGRGESMRHLQMKQWACTVLAAHPAVTRVEPEWVIRDRRADVAIWMAHPAADRDVMIAIECQASPTTTDNIVDKYATYTQAGVHCAYLFDAALLKGRYQRARLDGLGFPLRIPAWISRTPTFSRIAALDQRNGEEVFYDIAFGAHVRARGRRTTKRARREMFATVRATGPVLHLQARPMTSPTTGLFTALQCDW